MICDCWKCGAENDVGDNRDRRASVQLEPQYRCWKCGHLNNGSALKDDTVTIGKQTQGAAK